MSEYVPYDVTVLPRENATAFQEGVGKLDNETLAHKVAEWAEELPVLSALSIVMFEAAERLRGA
jgi:hypothetical protein